MHRLCFLGAHSLSGGGGGGAHMSYNRAVLKVVWDELSQEGLGRTSER